MPSKKFPWAGLLCLCGGLCLAGSQYLIFRYAPTEAVMGTVQKIFYFHLPLSWWALISFFIVFLSSIAFLFHRNPGWDRLARASAEVGVVFTTLCLITGMLWGKRAWGVWWTWDPRLSTALVMWFVYMAYLILDTLNLSLQRRQLVRAVVGTIAFLDVPLVFLSARMWRSIHPAVFANNEGGLDPEMKLTALVCVGSMGLLWAGLILIRKTQFDQESTIDRLLFELDFKGDSND